MSRGRAAAAAAALTAGAIAWVYALERWPGPTLTGTAAGYAYLMFRTTPTDQEVTRNEH